MIEIKDLYYGDRRAVGPLSATIEAGQIVGLLGLNGAGKTTTLRILACDLLPTSGTVQVDGVDVVEEPTRVRAMTGYLPEVPPLYGEMTVHEFLQFAARLRRIPSAELESRVREVEQLTRVRKVRNQAVFSLSHGYRQRLGIAQAIVHRPRLVVLDEPMSGLDPVQIVEMRKLVRNLGGEHTVVVSSHILSEISEMCDRILVIRDGEISAAGTEAQLCETLLSGMQVTVSVRETPQLDATDVQGLLSAVGGVQSVTAVAPAESGTGIATFEVQCGSDARERIARALVSGGAPLLQLSRSERELESVFLRLSGQQRATGTAGAGSTMEEVQ